MSFESPTEDRQRAERPDPVPADAQEALELVQDRFGLPTLPDGTSAPLRAHEFDLGYVVYAVCPPPADVGGVPQPAEPGGSNFVVAKDNGEIVTVPNYPVELAIQVFKKHYRAGRAHAPVGPDGL
ncbi:hypothetical protein [Streptomyces chryseus]